MCMEIAHDSANIGASYEIGPTDLLPVPSTWYIYQEHLVCTRVPGDRPEASLHSVMAG